MKYLLWQFSAYAAVALALGVVVGRWTMAGRLSSAERDRQRAAFELSMLTMKASSLLEESVRERSSIVDANGRLAEELRTARDLQTRIEADLKVSELNRSQAESSLRAAGERFATDRTARTARTAATAETAETAATAETAKPHPSTGSTDRDPVDRADFERVAGELHLARAELARVTHESSVALAMAEARATAAESAHLELSRVHAASVRTAQVELTRAVVRAERAETVVSVRPARRASRVAEDRIVDLRPFDRVPEPTADGLSE